MSSFPDPPVQRCYEHCRRLHRRHDPTYYWGTRRLRPDLRPAVHALYAFARTADDIVDGPRRGRDPEACRAELDAYERRLEGARRGERSDDPVITALTDSARRHGLPLEELRLYFDSMRTDCGPVRIATWEELERYMDGSVGAVGRILAVLVDAPPGRHESFTRLAFAFQLTNFIRDVREDWELDRVYLPAEDRARFGVSVDEIAKGEPSDGFRRLLALEVGRARELFREGDAAVEVVTPDVRRGMRLAKGVYLRILDRAERLGFDVLRHRAGLRPWELVGAVAGALRAGA
ncbi:MAG TPA: phytoene/squalene synthase family protein [Thermoleophilaceae bacterium]|nr:phytoene/squalene synthase family protein [Thermoleophilaceae bacterium]